MTQFSLRTQIGAAALGLVILLSPSLSFANSSDVQDQDSGGSAGDEVSTQEALLTQLAQVVSSLSATVSTEGARAAMGQIQAALEAGNQPGSLAVIRATAGAISELIEPETAETLPVDLTGEAAVAALDLVSTMITVLEAAARTDPSVTVPAVLITLSNSLTARIS